MIEEMSNNTLKSTKKTLLTDLKELQKLLTGEDEEAERSLQYFHQAQVLKGMIKCDPLITVSLMQLELI